MELLVVAVYRYLLLGYLHLANGENAACFHQTLARMSHKEKRHHLTAHQMIPLPV